MKIPFLPIPRLVQNIILVIFLVNFKSWPLVWHIRLGLILLRADIRRIYLSTMRSINSKPSRRMNPHRLFKTMREQYQAGVDDLDFNLHMSNSSYNKILDYARTQFFARHLLEVLRREKLYLPNAGVVSLYHRQIEPFTTYTVETRLLSFDTKWIFIAHRFVSTKNDELIVHSHHLSKYVFKKGRKTIPPIEVMEMAGYIGGLDRDVEIEALEAQANEGREVTNAMLAMEGLHSHW